MLRQLEGRIGGALRDLLSECRRKESVALLAVTLILVSRHALGTPGGLNGLRPLWASLAILSPLFNEPVVQHQLIAIALQLSLPPLLIIAVHRQRLSEHGLGPGDVRFWLPIAAIVLVIQLLVIALYLSRDPSYITRYPSLAQARAGGLCFWAWEGSRLLYMLSWEFLFRGYLLFTLFGRIGLLACAVQTAPFVLVHVISSKPTSEVYFTVLSGLISAIFALEARSIWPLALLHGAGAVLLDVFIVYA